MKATPSWSWISSKGFTPWKIGWKPIFCDFSHLVCEGIVADQCLLCHSTLCHRFSVKRHLFRFFGWKKEMKLWKSFTWNSFQLPQSLPPLGMKGYIRSLLVKIVHLYPRHLASCRDRMTRSVARPRPLAAGDTAIIFMSKSSEVFALEKASLPRT